MDIKAELQTIQLVKRDLAVFRDIFPHTPFNENEPCPGPETGMYWQLDHLIDKLDTAYAGLACKGTRGTTWPRRLKVVPPGKNPLNSRVS